MEAETYPDDRIDSHEDLASLRTRGIETDVSRDLVRKPDDEFVVWNDADAIVDRPR